MRGGDVPSVGGARRFATLADVATAARFGDALEGINIVGAMRLARDLGPGKTVVTILCDGGSRYQSKLFNPAFLREKNLPIPPWMK